MDFGYMIQYKSRVDNVVADALSRVPSATLLLMAMSTIQPNLMELIEKS